jgi:hypothetical protein
MADKNRLPEFGHRGPAPAVTSRPGRTYREPEDDFFCLRYQVFYRSTDCAIRTKFKTSAGCLDCEQGRFNLKRHSSALRRVRFHFALED